jgi:hypothetical protein
MSTSVSLNWRRIVTQALVAGIIAGVTIELYLYLTSVLPTHGSIFAVWQYIASAAFGKAAYQSEQFVWIGLAMHFLVSIGWAGGYAYFAQVQRFVNQRWFLSGLGYGVVVLLFMQILMIGAQVFHFPATPLVFLNDIVAHTLFFGVPVAYVVARMNAA